MEHFISNLNKNKHKIIQNMSNCKDLFKDEFNWNNRVRYSSKKYNKVILFRNDDFELVLISWLPGQHSKMHYHPKNGCIMKLLYGQLHEIRYKNSNDFEELDYKKNDISYMCDQFGQHVITNIEDIPAISLHLYSPPGFYK